MVSFAIHALALIAVSAWVWLLRPSNERGNVWLALAAALAFLAALALEALYAR